jgi:hypothetical protein
MDGFLRSPPRYRQLAPSSQAMAGTPMNARSVWTTPVTVDELEVCWSGTCNIVLQLSALQQVQMPGTEGEVASILNSSCGKMFVEIPIRNRRYHLA